MMRLTEEQLAAMVQRNKPRVVSRMDIEQVTLKPIEEAKPRKYRNRKCDLEGMKFDSVKEREHYLDLKLRERAGEIRDIRRQVKFDIVVNGHPITRFYADFVYHDIRKDKQIVEDVKGFKGGESYRRFRLKKKLMFAVHRIVVEEV